MQEQTYTTSDPIDGLIDQLVCLKDGVHNDPKIRDEAIFLSKKIIQNLEKPEQMALDMIYSVK